MDPADPRFQEAVSDFNRGRYFEAHEVWEELWKEERAGDPSRLFLQGLIQVAAGYHKLPQLHLRGARGLLSRGLEKLAKYPERHLGIDLLELRRGVGEDLRRLAPLDESSYSREALLWPRISTSP
jgi:predicted metal-dependent hydrolase